MADTVDFKFIEPYGKVRVYGPYTRKDGREHVCLLYENRKRQTVSYPKFLVEVRLGKLLGVEDTVDHINCDFLDNRPENLQVLIRSEHASLDVKRITADPVVCPTCGDSFTPTTSQIRKPKTKDQEIAGPFCSKSCAGFYGASVQNGGKRLSASITPFSYASMKEHQKGKPSE